MGWFWRKMNKKRTLERGAMVLKDLIELGHGISNPIKFFSADEILKATNNFSKSNHVFRLAYYSDWYSGKNENHPMILIKKRARFWSLRTDLMCRDIAVSSMVSGHKNFLKLVGCCLELEKPVLVYDGVKKHYRLKISEQTWKRRMKIAEDIATALAYLHTAFPRPFVYRTLFPWNILLDEDGVAKLIDFSFCVSIPEGETFVRVDRAEGFYSWLLDDSGISLDRVVSEKTDVFAFGMFMGRRLLLGNRRIGEKEESEGGGSDTGYASKMKRRVQNVMSKLKEDRRMEEIADPKMIEKMGHISEQELCQMNAFLMLSRRCIGPSEEVPTMVEVAKELKKIQRSPYNDSSSPSDETQFDSAQDISSSVILSNQT
ncbi:probable inactive receptor-like protein kinase At1g65250 [Arabidopsis lyrata subsp. lyrata]|uniref:probable inactive receptor-like protein kinase At1g65250 n=1 Tax=Arabidopsis lyrata subsp. lyrata TaxID=81972 RepID=UPI000A29CA14|nr:probable inactive receptor-like protein kinase At1g65250 [Arabidopsis lyrata subsp. lyrata]|eukprot:XP_020890921.1 probable inactive receptor-like protein kinase At1g65250 [Arabidopsis lyrata subsp. lyrata]